MAWVVGIVVVLIIIGTISSAASKNEEVQKKLEFNEMAKTRVDAYVDYLRRTSKRPEFSRMTDLELKDIISQKITPTAIWASTPSHPRTHPTRTRTRHRWWCRTFSTMGVKSTRRSNC